MPELPEVETVKNVINPLLKGKTISNIEIFFDKLILTNLADFKKSLLNQTFLNVSRYGKYLFLHLTNQLVIITHLRMEGKFRYSESLISARKKHTSLIFYFTDNTAMSFDDTRKFGIMYLSNENEYKYVPMIKKLGIEANKVKESDYEFLIKKFNRNKNIKELLLDQSILTGIGNIYADETLFLSNINPLTKGNTLSKDEIIKIINNAEIVLNKAIKLGGSTIHSFQAKEGIDGKFQEELNCYGKVGKPCPRCSTIFQKIFISGRGTTFCPNCQINKNLEKAIGITGKIGSGKSLVLSFLKETGYFTISADNEIHELYKDQIIKNKLSKILCTDFDYFDIDKRNIIKDIIIKDKLKRIKLEEYIYPILTKKLEEYVKKYDKVAIEVPLLFNAHLEYLFKKIFVIEINETKQISNLKNRNIDINQYKKLNQNFYIDKNNNKIIKIENNSTKEELFSKILNNL